ncbi:TRAP transporter large permease [Rhodobacteraceae bacterium RKSG542]|uniref:TRAP transporter large permease n=1 Tax=Pseudovibrio flavus TaxID=2529854 RepID=UPI0012BD1A4E|nr:TRAP transporter large permease [Pseudovibrio flavus]MTI18190.1 TRAP transporter large permease [Pseudovibrio flavus]
MMLILAAFAVFLLLGMPVAFAIGIASFTFFLTSEFVPTNIAIQRIAAASQSFPLLAVPFFVLAGNLMNATGITKRLIGFAIVCTGWMAGGLAQVTIALSALMGGISGSAVADSAMQARILGPSMLERGFSKGFTGCAIAFSSLICATIPPSIGLILYGFVGSVSIGRLFLAGIIPGLLMAVFLMGTTYIVARRRGYKAELQSPPSFKEVMVKMNEAKWALLFPIFLIGGIRFGIFTPSEAGAFAVLYALVVGFLVYNELTWADVWKVTEQSVSDIGMIMLIIMLSSMLGYAIVFEQVPQSLSALVLGVSESPMLITFLILVFLAICGMFVESTVLVLLLTPIFVPVITKMGVDPVHFGILMMTTVTMGSMTPPVGVAMYTVCGILKCPTEEYIRESIPFILAIFALIVFIAFFPQVALFLPNMLF